MNEQESVSRRNILFAYAVVPDKLGGGEQFAIEMARQLKPHGRQLVLCFERPPVPGVEEALLAPGNVTLEVFSRQAAISLENAKRFQRLLTRYKPEAVLYTLGGVVRLWPLLAKLNGVSRILYSDGTSRRNMNYRAGWRVRMLMRPLTKAICVSRFVKSCSDREGIVPAGKSSVIYNAADIDHTKGDGAAFRRQYGIPQDRIVVLKVSWLVPEKGIDVALRAAKLALAQRDDLHFVFCGDGRHREEYRRMADTFGIGDHITWTGQIVDLMASGAFAAANMQIQCSQWQEAFCMAVAEGMSAGLPVIASRIGGLPELISEGENGYLFEPKDEQALAARILKLAGDKALREQMGRNGRARAIERHDLRKNVASWVELLVGEPGREKIKLPIRAAEA